MALHNSLTGTEIHVPYAFTYATAVARLAATGFTSADVGKLALQSDTSGLYILTDDSPIEWEAVGSGGVGSGGSITVDGTELEGDVTFIAGSYMTIEVDGGTNEVTFTSTPALGLFNWLGSVATYADVAGTYPSPEHNDALIVQADEGHTNDQTYYVYDSSTAAWVYMGTYNYVPDATTTTKGIVELATSGETGAGKVVQGNDARLSAATTTTSGIVELATNGENAANVVVQGNDDRLDAEWEAAATAPSDTTVLWVDTSTSPPLSKYYNGASWTTIGSASSGDGGSFYKELRPVDFSFDDTDAGVDAGTLFDIIDTLDFSPDVDGTVFVTLAVSPLVNVDGDILIDLEYSLSGSDDAENLKFTTNIWVKSAGDTLALASPTSTYTDTIISAVTNTGVLASETITAKVTAASLTALSKIIAISFTREGVDAADTYTGTFQLISMKLYQA